MKDAHKSLSEIQRERVLELIDSGKIDEIYDAIEKLSLSGREKTVLGALTSRELVRGIVGNTAKEILDEVEKINDNRFTASIGIKIWTVLNQLTESRLIQTIQGSPKLYVLNRELNPMVIMSYPHSLLESLYDVLPELESHRSEVSCRITSERIASPSSGAYSTNQDYIRMLIEMVSLARKEILGTSLLIQTFEEFPSYVYAFGRALERGVQAFLLLSAEAPSRRIRGLRELGADVRVISEGILRRHDIANVDVIDRRHFMEVNRHEYRGGERIRFGFWCKYNPVISARYVKAFWDVWDSAIS